MSKSQESGDAGELDIIQKVCDRVGRFCGQIAWESKKTKTWSESWIQKLTLLLTNQELRYRLGREGRKKIEQDYSLEKNAEIFVKILEVTFSPAKKNSFYSLNQR